jgi:hypothetical protein
MKTQRTTRCLLSVALCTLVLGSYARAGGGFLDDFSDGDILDGSPVSWQWDPQGGQCAVSPQGLQLSPAQVYWWPLQLLATDKHGARVQYRSNMTVKAQFNLGIEPTTIACIALVTPDYQPGSATGSYLLAFNRTWFFLARDGVYRADWHWSTQGRFDPAEDIIMQLDLIDITDGAGQRTASRLECRWWVAGQAMPVQPQIVGVDSVYDLSAVMLGAFTDSVAGSRSSPVVFRWVEVIGSEIEVEPIVDFNGDGTVDIDDLLRLIESWGQDDPAVDIVPDGVVDKKDLEVLMDYWQQDVNDPTLLAHWALNETEGMTASDSARDHDGIVIGLPAWQPAGGAVDGALEFNRTTFVLTDPVLGPSVGPFSIFAWVKGGAPGQAIISQQAGAEWLMADPATGALRTELKGGGRLSSALCSDTVITDGDWHRVGLVWDGTHRRLYVDDLLVAEDTQDGLGVSSGKMLIGCGKNMAAGTFWSGLIDDVRIYNRAVRP